MSVLSQLPPVIERHELKYLIPIQLVDPITEFLSPYCSMDYFSTQADDGFYGVNSLYLDSPNYEFLKQRLWGKDNRFNMRVRAYGDGTKPPYFVEIKNKVTTIVKKYRSTLSDDEWPAILQDPSYRVPTTDAHKERANKELFLRLALSYAVEPKILTQYRRRAFFSTVDNYARVTMDVDMKYRLEDSLTINTSRDMINYDNENIYGNTEVTNGRVVLELKCNVGAVPIWMIDLITHFQLEQKGFSKFMNSVLTSNYDDGFNYAEAAGRYAMYL